MNKGKHNIVDLSIPIEAKNQGEYYHRMVLVNFKEDVTDEILSNFVYGIQMLAEKTEKLERFSHSHLLSLQNENVLSRHVPDVNIPDFMSSWSFLTIEDLEDFISSDIHKQIAQLYFRPAVKTRTVFNFYL